MTYKTENDNIVKKKTNDSGHNDNNDLDKNSTNKFSDYIIFHLRNFHFSVSKFLFP